MTSVAERRRRKEAQQRRAEEMGLTLADTPKRQRGTGRKVQPRSDRGGADPRKTALNARCRQEGKAMTMQNRLAVSGPLNGSPVGLCIQAVRGVDTRKAWDAWCGFTAAMRTYEMRILEKSVHAKTAKIEMEPERVETNDHHTIDDRDDEQRDRDAVNNWMRWKGHLWELGRDKSVMIEAARRDETGLWQEAAPTEKGEALARALSDLAKVVEGR